MKKKDSVFVPLIIFLSIIIPISVTALMLLPEILHVDLGGKLSFLPKAHALLNGATAILLIIGFVLIKNTTKKYQRRI